MREYNGFGQLVQVIRDAQTITYTYRPDGLRHSKSTKNPFTSAAANTATYLWDGANIFAELNESSEIKAHYMRGAGLVYQKIGENSFYYLHNAHGDVVQQIDGYGNATPKYRYDSFGNLQKPILAEGEQQPPDLDPNPFRYCGELWDKDLEEYYLRARSYNPANGRFTSEDPARNEQNWYIYGDNNPVTWIDPSGEVPTWAKWAIGAVVIVGLVAASVATGGAAALVAGAAFSSTAAAATTLGAVGAITTSVVSTGAAVLAAKVQGTDVGEAAADAFMWGAIGGGAGGALGGTGIGAAGQVIGNAAISYGSYAGSTIANGDKLTLEGSLWSAGAGAVGGWLGGRGYFSPETTYGRMLASGNPNALLYKSGKISTLSNVGAMAARQGAASIARGATAGSVVAGTIGFVPNNNDTSSSTAQPPVSRPTYSGSNYTPPIPALYSSGSYAWYTVKAGESPILPRVPTILQKVSTQRPTGGNSLSRALLMAK